MSIRVGKRQQIRCPDAPRTQQTKEPYRTGRGRHTQTSGAASSKSEGSGEADGTGIGGFGVRIAEDGSAAMARDGTGKGVLNGRDRAEERGVHGRILERQIGIGGESAVFEGEILAITQGLRAGDMAADEAEVLTVPTEVFTVNLRVIDGDVLTVPEGVFGVQHSVVNLYVAGILEDVFTHQPKVADTKIAGVHKGIETLLYFEVGDFAGMAVPERLVSISHLDAFEGQVVYFAEGFRRINKTVVQPQVAVVPHRRAVGSGETAVTAGNILAFPDDIHTFEKAINGFYMPRLFEPRLPLADSDTFEPQLAALIQRPFAGERLVCYTIIHEFIKLNGFILDLFS